MTSQLVIPNKRPRFGPKVCTRSWWIDRIKGSENPKYTSYWTHYSNYQVGQFKAVAEFDYQVLGERVGTQGAPDSGLASEYPNHVGRKALLANLELQRFPRLQALDLDSSNQDIAYQ